MDLYKQNSIDTLEAVYAAYELPITPKRQMVSQDGVSLLSMPSLGTHWAGVKTVTVQPTNPSQGIPRVHGV